MDGYLVMEGGRLVMKYGNGVPNHRNGMKEEEEEEEKGDTENGGTTTQVSGDDQGQEVELAEPAQKEKVSGGGFRSNKIQGENISDDAGKRGKTGVENLWGTEDEEEEGYQPEHDDWEDVLKGHWRKGTVVRCEIKKRRRRERAAANG